MERREYRWIRRSWLVATLVVLVVFAFCASLWSVAYYLDYRLIAVVLLWHLVESHIRLGEVERRLQAVIDLVHHDIHDASESRKELHDLVTTKSDLSPGP